MSWTIIFSVIIGMIIFEFLPTILSLLGIVISSSFLAIKKYINFLYLISLLFLTTLNDKIIAFFAFAILIYHFVLFIKKERERSTEEWMNKKSPL